MGASPIFLGLSDGYYQFATVAVDRAGNREALPAVGDAEIRVGPEAVNDGLGSPFQGQAQATNGRDGTIGLVWSDNRNSATITDIYFARRQDATFTWGTNERVDDAAAVTLATSMSPSAARRPGCGRPACSSTTTPSARPKAVHRSPYQRPVK